MSSSNVSSSATALTLPPVAKSFYTFCKKCDADRYHRVLAHTSSTTAKIECEVCHSRKAYSLPTPGSEKRRIAATANKVQRAAKTHTGEYELRTQNMSNKETITYSIKESFKENQKVNHPKFGIGFVQKVYDEKVDVIFSDEVRSLVHNRK